MPIAHENFLGWNSFRVILAAREQSQCNVYDRTLQERQYCNQRNRIHFHCRVRGGKCLNSLIRIRLQGGTFKSKSIGRTVVGLRCIGPFDWPLSFRPARTSRTVMLPLYIFCAADCMSVSCLSVPSIILRKVEWDTAAIELVLLSRAAWTISWSASVARISTYKYIDRIACETNDRE